MNPNFFIIGAPKCGTTALIVYLKTHPNVFICSPKEPNYFSQDRPFLIRRSLKSYLRLFEDADPKVHLAVGEGSTRYLRSSKAVGNILAFNPQAKFIVMLRNPIDHFNSLHKHMLYNGMEKYSDPEEAWRAERERSQGKGIPLLTHSKSLLYSQWSLFGEQVGSLFAQVPKEQVMVILFDDFAADPAGTYRKLLAFLGIPDDGRTDFPRVNEGKAVRRAWLKPFMRVLTITHEMLEVKFGLFRNIRRGMLLRLNAQPAPQKPLPEAFRKQLADFYREDIQKLSKLLGRDLSHWDS